MNIALIPSIVFLFLVLVSPNSNQPKKDNVIAKIPVKKAIQGRKQSTRNTKEEELMVDFDKENQPSINQPSINQDVSQNEELEFKTILAYIQTEYPKITQEDAKKIAEYLVQYGKEHNVDPKFAAALIARESAFNKEAVSVTGAKGLGQIKDFNFKDLNIGNPFDIKQNISGTTKYLKEMLGNWDMRMKEPKKHISEGKKVPQTESEKIKLALASYYKGFSAVNKEGMDPKTSGYVNDILKKYSELITLKEKVKEK
jgi:membrane-bound lytic murein transglycosylase MltF